MKEFRVLLTISRRTFWNVAIQCLVVSYDSEAEARKMMLDFINYYPNIEAVALWH